MIHRVGRPLWRTVLSWMLALVLVFSTLVPFSATTPPSARVLRLHQQVLVPAWKNGTTVFVPSNLPTTRGAVTVVRVPFVAQSAAYAKASRLARIPQAPTVALPRSPWGDAAWNPITDKVQYEPWTKHNLLYFIGTVRAVSGGTTASLQSAMNAAVDGDIVQLTADVALATRATAPNRGDAGSVLITTDQSASLPAARTVAYNGPGSFRPSVAQLQGQRKLTQTGGVGYNIAMAQGARGWHFRGIYFDSTVTYPELGGHVYWGAVTQTTLAHQPSYLIAEQCYFDGGSRPGTSAITVQRGIVANCEYFYIIDTRMEYFWGKGSETNTIGGWNGIGKGLIANNTLDGGSEMVLFGGGITSMGSGEYQSDIVIRHTWGERGAAQLSRVGGFVGNKNFLEGKNMRRNVWEANRFIGHNAGGQLSDFVIGPKAQGSAEQAWVRTHHTWVRHNYVTNGQGPAGAANSASDPPGSYVVGALGNNYTDFLNNLSHSPYTVANTQIVSYGSASNTIGTFVVRNCTYHMQHSKFLDLSPNLRTNANPDTRIYDNVFFRVASPSFYYAVLSSGSPGLQDAVALDACCGAGNWVFRSNLANMTNKTTATAVYGAVLAGAPHNNKSKNSNTMLFAKDTGGVATDYTLAESAYQTMSTTGGRPGVNMTLLNQALSGVAA